MGQAPHLIGLGQLVRASSCSKTVVTIFGPGFRRMAVPGEGAVADDSALETARPGERESISALVAAEKVNLPASCACCASRCCHRRL